MIDWSATIGSRALLPLSGLYWAGTTVRNALFDRALLKSARAPLPVLCVGNVTAGGSGKTPFIGYLAEALLHRGRNPVILTRGYGGSTDGPHLVTASDTAKDVGDEAVLHFRMLGSRVPVMVAAERALGALRIAEERLGDVVLLDDGYQHRWLERDLNILLLDVSSKTAIDRWQLGRVLPAGYLRESLGQALKRASCVVFVHRTAAPGGELSHLPQVAENHPRFNFFLYPDRLIDLHNGALRPPNALNAEPVLAVSAIAAPEQFFSMLDALGVKVVDRRRFPDHYAFTEDDWRELQARKLPLVTTAKDAVKLERFVTAPGQVVVLQLASRLGASHEEAFFALVDRACNGRLSTTCASGGEER